MVVAGVIMPGMLVAGMVVIRVGRISRPMIHVTGIQGTMVVPRKVLHGEGDRDSEQK